MLLTEWIKRTKNLQFCYYQKRKHVLVLAFGAFSMMFILANINFKDGRNFLSEAPRHNIVLLKTHKCASTTVQNILLRYGERNNLTFALPSNANYFGHPKRFNRDFVPEVKGHQFNIMTHHTRFHFQELSLMMPSDSAFITIIREPTELQESLYSYYLLDDYYRMSLETMLKNKSVAFRILGEKRYVGRVGLNQMAFDLGLDPSDFLNPEIVIRFCNLLDRQFDLVLMAERMSESLILLMDLMRWTLDDVVSFKRNARSSKSKFKLSNEGRAHLQKLNIADEIIYDHFKRRFEERVQEYGINKMADIVNQLTRKNAEIYNLCVRDIVDNSGIEDLKNKTKYGYNERYMMHYELKDKDNEMCQSLLRKELEYTAMLRKRQTIENKRRKT